MIQVEPVRNLITLPSISETVSLEKETFLSCAEQIDRLAMKTSVHAIRFFIILANVERRHGE